MARFSTGGRAPRGGIVTTVNMTTGEIVRVAEAHSERQVARLVHKAQRRRSRALRAASVSAWQLGAAS